MTARDKLRGKIQRLRSLRSELVHSDEIDTVDREIASLEGLVAKYEAQQTEWEKNRNFVKMYRPKF